MKKIYLRKLILFGACVMIFINPLLTQNSVIKKPETSLIAGQKITGSKMVLTADKYARLCWTMTETNIHGVSCHAGFTSEYRVGKRIGVGYKWGGWTHIIEFEEKTKDGYGTGTGGYVSYKDYSIDCVVGVSCTGLVSRAWDLNRKFTLDYPDRPDIPNQFDDITDQLKKVDFITKQTNTLKKGDAFMNKGHIIMFVYETRDGYPMVIDSRSIGVSFRKTDWNEMADGGYIAIRYNNIIEKNNPVGTKNNPIIIDVKRLPLTLKGNTRDVVSMEYDNYSCDISDNQQGPEVIYKINLKSETILEITINDYKKEGIDNDIFLLTSLKKDNNNQAYNCIAGDDNRIMKKLKSGTYYLIIDSNKDLPGEYLLKLTTK